MPIGAPSPTVAKIAAARIGASRHGKFSSLPALLTTSAVRSARTALAAIAAALDAAAPAEPTPEGRP